ncbi:MAG: alpha/beta fold hydrolase [Alphaproteobacteria bacterium]|jgi:pimeloyl-ACP methyl ester carboxylesterase
MPFFERGDVRIYYEVHGEGFPVLALAAGGMRSAMPFWENAAWNPMKQLAPGYQVIAMDQRNAGQSTAPISGTDGWQDYRDDQLALLDHLGVERCHVAGMCIGGSFIMELIEAAPERVAAAVMLQPIGYEGNRQAYFDLFDSWAAALKTTHPAVSDAEWAQFRQTMFGSEDLLFNLTEDHVAKCPVPLLVLMGKDIYHPEAISRKIVEVAPQATLVEHWKEPEHVAAASAAVDGFLAKHS